MIEPVRGLDEHVACANDAHRQSDAVGGPAERHRLFWRGLRIETRASVPRNAGEATLRRFAFAFSIAFPLIYVVARARGLALITVYPLHGVVLAGMHRSRDVGDA
jgi:hypothetical protein